MILFLSIQVKPLSELLNFFLSTVTTKLEIQSF